jgi:nucleotide-binding universal stress UspA family protein
VTDSQEWTEIHEGWLAEGNALLEKEAARLREMGVKEIETVLRDGEAAYEIVAVAKERGADLIVMATHHYSAMGKLFMGSVTDRVTKRSPCPVLWVFK